LALRKTSAKSRERGSEISKTTRQNNGTPSKSERIVRGAEVVMSEPVRETITVQADGRTTIPDKIREHLQIKGQKAFCEIETYGKDKALIRVMSRWKPNKRGPGKDVVKK